MADQDFYLIAGVCLLSGFALGLLVNQFLARGRKSPDVREQLNQTEKRLQSYRSEVNQSFQETAELLNDLAQRYRDVHNHLAESAEQLLDEHQQPALTPLPEPEASPSQHPEKIKAPLDYAPQSGALAEGFGIEKISSAEEGINTPVVDVYIPQKGKA